MDTFPLIKQICSGVRNGMVLDLGCGNGRYSRRFAESGNIVTAVDKKFVPERALHRGIHYLQQDITDFEIELGAYDLIFANNVLPFFLDRQNIEMVLERCVAGLKDKGFLFFSLFGQQDGWYGAKDDRLFYAYNELPRIGLKVVDPFGPSEDIFGGFGQDLVWKQWHIYRFLYQNV